MADAANGSCLQSQEEVQVTQVINAFVPLLLVVLGNVFNILAILVMRTKHFRFLSTSVYMVAGAVNDATSLVVALIPHWLNANYAWTIVRTPSSFIMCGFFNFYGWSNCDFSIVVTAAMTADRAYAIVQPLKSTSRDLRKRAHKALAVLVVLVIAKNFHFWFGSDIVPFGQPERLCIVNSSSQTYMYFYSSVWPFLHIAFLTVCFVIIIVSNAIIIHHVRQSAQGRFSRKSRQLSTGKVLQESDSCKTHGHENGAFTLANDVDRVSACEPSNNGCAESDSFKQRQNKTRRGILSRMKGKRANLFRIRFSSLDHNANQSARDTGVQQSPDSHGETEHSTDSSEGSSSFHPKPGHGVPKRGQHAGSGGMEASKGRRTPRAAKLSRRGSRSSEKWRQITVMLLADSFALVLLTYPFSCFLAVSLATGPPVTCWEQALSALLFSVTFYLLYSNKCVNFCLYCVTGSRFRQALRELLRGCCARKPLPPSSRLSWLSSRRLVEKIGQLGEDNSSDDPHCASISAAVDGCKSLQPALSSQAHTDSGTGTRDPCLEVWTSEGSGHVVLETCFGAGLPYRRRHHWPAMQQNNCLDNKQRSRSFLPPPELDAITVEMTDLNDSGFHGDTYTGRGMKDRGSIAKRQAEMVHALEDSDSYSVRDAKTSIQLVHDDRQNLQSAKVNAVDAAGVFRVCQRPVYKRDHNPPCQIFSENSCAAMSDDTVEIFV